MDPKINDILKAFKLKYPKLNPIELFKLNDGYVICAPRVTQGVDYNDPYFFISSDLTKIEGFKMSKKMDLFEAISKGAIWKR